MNSSERDSLAASITRQASTQTFYMIRFLADRDRVPEAFRAYAYFRWVDDILDATAGSQAEKLTFVERQRGLLEDLYHGIIPLDLLPEEQLLQDLVKSDPRLDSGLFTYLDRMMAVMEFDTSRRGRLITQAQRDNYIRDLAVAVTEAMHYFIGHDQYAPQDESRYLAVSAAHITHMLRDAVDDTQEGYYNIPLEVQLEGGLDPFDLHQEAYRRWVCSQIKLARSYFKSGRGYLSRVRSLRCRLAGYAYSARFEWVLRTIQRENFCLRLEYPDRKKLPSAVWMMGRTLLSLIQTPVWKKVPIPLPASEVEASRL
jgi:phytoene/squalene synthetase